MIPITVSVFLKQGTNRLPLVQAAIYSGTIVVMLSTAALFLLGVFRTLSVNPWLNLALGGIFVFFALSLFGMYELVVPAWLTNVFASREGGGSILGTVFTALTFGLVSFSCVAPFLGGFSAIVASGDFNWAQLVAGAVTFSGTFAAPFFLLALFPSLLRSLPRAGNWLNVVKVVMGFLELAAAIKFLRAGELRLVESPAIMTYDFSLALYVVLAVGCGLYLLDIYRLPHDERLETVGVPRFLFALGFLAVGLYLTPALFPSGGERPRPGGTLYAWVDAFLLPETEGESGPARGRAGRSPEGPAFESPTGDLAKTLSDARAEKKLVFLDFTGVVCTNCRLNEKGILRDPEVRQILRDHYKVVQLYTDEVPASLYPPADRDGLTKARQEADAKKNFEYQKATFNGNETLPLYAVLYPQEDGSGKPFGKTVEGVILDRKAFITFLKEPLTGR
jgi:thiol:disulfide interchange protein DsbD